MSLMLVCQDVHKAIGPRTLFQSLSFTVNKGDRLAVIGANGSGKTTLLRILAGLDSPDRGSVNLTQSILLGFLPQQEELDPQTTASGVLLASLQEQRLEDAEKYKRVHAMLSRADFSDPDAPVRTLSGGWRKRLAVCRALLHQPDLLIMDEPTNHLDLQGIVWLEQLLASSFPGAPSTFIFVSHDRYFLENLASRIIEIAPSYPAGYLHVEGNYSTFLQRKEEFLQCQQEQENRLAGRVRRETEWLHRGPKARTTKARSRIDTAYRLTEELKQLQGHNRKHSPIEIDFEATGRKTKKLLVTTGLAKSFGDTPLFAGLHLVLSPGSRIGLLGKNGCGKSTLMHILASAGAAEGLQPDRGEIRTADGVRIMYFAQDRQMINPDATLRQALSPEGDSIMYHGRSVHVATWARKFLFRTDQLDTPVGNLSGGEKARIHLAELMRQPADILLLDEPTNDLDIPSLQVLEEGLLDFPGAVVLVTHDRYLLNRVCHRVLGFVGEGNVAAFADFEQWHRFMQDQEKKTAGPGVSPKKKKPGVKAGRLSYLDQREYDRMEETILAAEEEEQQILKVMNAPANAADQTLLENSWKDLETVRQRILQLYERWDELETRKNSCG